MDSLYLVLGKYRSIAVSTPWAYKSYRSEFGDSYIRTTEDLESRAAQVHSGPMVKAIANKNGSEIGQLLHNDLEKVVLPAYPQVSQLRDTFQNSGALGVMMSGSGPTVFALCESQDQAQEIEQQMRNTITDPDLDFWVTTFCSNGIRMI